MSGISYRTPEELFAELPDNPRRSGPRFPPGWVSVRSWKKTGQIDDPEITSSLLLDIVERLVRGGERRRLALANGAIAAYERLRAEGLLAS